MACIRSLHCLVDWENIAHNINRKNTDLKLYEFGKTYHLHKKYTEHRRLILLACGQQKKRKLV